MILRYAKGIVATVLAFLGALETAMPDGVTGEEWVRIAVATLIIGGAVIGVPNAQKPPAVPGPDG